MERFVGVEEAREMLGRLVDEVAAGGDTVGLTKRGRPLAVLMSRDEYVRLKLAGTQQARRELAMLLEGIRDRLGDGGIDPDAIEAAITAARQV